MQGYVTGSATGFPVLFFPVPPGSSAAAGAQHPLIESATSRTWQHLAHHHLHHRSLAAAFDVPPLNQLLHQAQLQHQHHRRQASGPTRHLIADILGLDGELDDCERQKLGDITRSRESWPLADRVKEASPPSSSRCHHLSRPETVTAGRQSIDSDRSPSRDSNVSDSQSENDYITDDGKFIYCCLLSNKLYILSPSFSPRAQTNRRSELDTTVEQLFTSFAKPRIRTYGRGHPPSAIIDIVRITSSFNTQHPTLLCVD